MADVLNSIIPWILLAIGIFWAVSTFKEPIGRFIAWIKSFTSSTKDRFQPRDTSGYLTEFTYR